MCICELKLLYISIFDVLLGKGIQNDIKLVIEKIYRASWIG